MRSTDRGYSTISLTTFSGRLKKHPFVMEPRLPVTRVRSTDGGLSNPNQRELTDNPAQIRVLRGVRYGLEGLSDLRKYGEASTES